MIITGTSSSRLYELKKYRKTNIFTEQYNTSLGGSNGVVYNESIENQKIVYYIDGIKYCDNINNSEVTTTYQISSQGTNSPDFINAPVFKNPNKDNIISNPKISDDVFIDRQEISVFDKIYRLEHIYSVSELYMYAGGKYFYIKNNI